MNLGNISKKHLSFESRKDIPKDFTGSCYIKYITYYFLNGKLHREDGPAVELVDGSKEWYQNDKPHREDGPAIECANGDKSWYIHGKLHCIDGPAIEDADGYKCWSLNGVIHREDGPHIEYGRNKWWYLHGKKYDGEFTNESWKAFQRLMIF